MVRSRVHRLQLRTRVVDTMTNNPYEEILTTLLTHLNILTVDTPAHSPVTLLLFGLIIPPNSPLHCASVSLVQFMAVLFQHVPTVPYCKDLAPQDFPRPLTPLPASSTAGSAFFVPADGEPPPPLDPPAKDDPEDAPQNLLALITEHLSLVFSQRSQAGLDSREAGKLTVSSAHTSCCSHSGSGRTRAQFGNSLRLVDSVCSSNS